MIRRPDPSRSRLIARQVRTEYARDKVAKALYDLLDDGMDFGPCDLPTTDEASLVARSSGARPPGFRAG